MPFRRPGPRVIHRGLPLALSLLYLTSPRTAAAQYGAPASAQAAYDTVQTVRARAESLWTRQDPAGTEMLQGLLAWLGSPLLTDLSQRNPWLAARTANVWYDVALAAALRGDTATALDAVEKVFDTGGSPGYLRLFAQDSTFRRLRTSRRYRMVLARWQVDDRLWSDSAFAAPGSPDSLSAADRLAGLSLFWAEVRYNYPDLDTRPGFDWDSTYRAFIPRVLTARSAWDYYRTLQAFCATLHDSHTNVYFPRAWYISRYTRPPIETALIENRVLVLGFSSHSIGGLGLRVGDEIVAIDGLPVEQYVRDSIAPYVSAATPQDRAVREYWYELLRGAADRPVRLTVRHAGGSTAVIAVPRSPYQDVVRTPGVTERRLAGNVGYVAINNFEQDSIVPWFDAAMSRLGGVAALVIDVRHNGGGNSDPGNQIVRRLSNRVSLTSEAWTRAYLPVIRAWGMGIGRHWFPPDTLTPHPEVHYGMPVALLVGPATFSAAEDFTVAFRQMGRGIIVGEPTGGNTGQPMFFPLPGGGAARVRTKHDRFADGTEFTGIGIQPDILVRPTVAGVRAGRDEILDAAVKALTR